MAPLSTENSVEATVYNNPATMDAEALEALAPGQGVVRGAGGVESAGADSATRMVVREQRNSGSRGIEDNESPLEKGYTTGDNVEMLGFQRHDRARLLVAYADVDSDGTDDTYGEGTELGWNADGYLEPVTGGAPSEAVAFIPADGSVTLSQGDAPTHGLVQFY